MLGFAQATNGFFRQNNLELGAAFCFEIIVKGQNLFVFYFNQGPCALNFIALLFEFTFCVQRIGIGREDDYGKGGDDDFFNIVSLTIKNLQMFQYDLTSHTRQSRETQLHVSNMRGGLCQAHLCVTHSA